MGVLGVLRLEELLPQYRLFGRLERIPTNITLMDVVKRPLLTRERR
jgi:hypothetical protein